MKHILATTAMTLLLSTAAMADDHMSSFKTYDEPGVMDIYASDFIGMRVYSAEKDYETFDENATVDAGAEQNGMISVKSMTLFSIVMAAWGKPLFSVSAASWVLARKTCLLI